MSSPIQRVAARLRNISQLSTQIATGGIADEKTARLWPENIQVIAESLVDAGQTLKRYADEIETYQGRRREDNDALVTLAQTASNIATVIGSDGANLEVITHSDPEYVLGVLTRASDDARREAISRMPAEEKAKWLRWLGGGGLETLDKIGQIALKQIGKDTDKIIARWNALVEKLPEGILTEEEKKEFTDFSEEAILRESK